MLPRARVSRLNQASTSQPGAQEHLLQRASGVDARVHCWSQSSSSLPTTREGRCSGWVPRTVLQVQARFGQQVRTGKCQNKGVRFELFPVGSAQFGGLFFLVGVTMLRSCPHHLRGRLSECLELAFPCGVHWGCRRRTPTMLTVSVGRCQFGSQI